MALPGSPEPNTRTLPSASTSLDGGNIMEEAQVALDSYKKKDAKGAPLSLLQLMHSSMLTHLLNRLHLCNGPFPCALRQSYPTLHTLIL